MMNEHNKPENEHKSLWQTYRHCFGSAKDRSNQIRYISWMMIWAVSYVAATWLLKADYFSSPFTWLLAIMPSILGVIGFITYLRYLREADEMLQKIELEGLAIGFGVGVIFSLGYLTLEHVGLPEISASTIVVVMLFAWAFGNVLAARRYR